MIFIQIMLPILLFILGVIFASFGYVLVTRYPNWGSLIKGEKRSVCTSCGHRLEWFDLIPLISYLLLKGQCRYCKAKIPVSYFFTELIGGLLFVVPYFLYCYIYPSYNFEFIIDLGVTVDFVCISLSLYLVFLSSLIDCKTKEVPLTFTIALFIICLFHWGAKFAITGDYSLNSVLGLGIPLVLFGLIYLFCILFLHVEPMGISDILIYCFIGLLMGALQFSIILIVSCLVCSIVESIKIKKSGEKRQIPFVPYIFIGFLFSVLLGTPIMDGYLLFLGVK